jgi:predicted transcriptional regulator
MFVREKRIGRYRYVYLVESVREGGRIKQRIIKNLGRKVSSDIRNWTVGDIEKWTPLVVA